MMLFRKAVRADLPSIYALASRSGHGLTTLPHDLTLLEKQLEWSERSFRMNDQTPTNELYYFVLEDPNTHQVVGTSAILSNTGYEEPFYSYKLSKRTRISHEMNIRNDYEVLSLVNDYQNRSELCTLFLDAPARVNHNGLLLSRARFLFIANHPQRFMPLIIADMRGISDENGQSPFWDGVCGHFFHMPFIDADRLSLRRNKQFITDLMPRNPIYVSLIAKSAQVVIGKPHPNTVAAMKILQREGFFYNQYVDIFDAGPTLEAPRDLIRSIGFSRILTLKNLSDEVDNTAYILSNNTLECRATLAPLMVNVETQSCIMSKDTAALLNLRVGDLIRAVPLHIE